MKRKAKVQPIHADEAQLRRALDVFDFAQQHGPLDWPAALDLRPMAADLGVPYVLLLLAYYQHMTPATITLADLDEWTHNPEARRVLEAWTGNERKVA